MAEILPNSPNDVASRGVTNATLAQFKGLARQVVINIDDGFRPVIMDGLTLGGKSKVALVTDLSNYVSKSTYSSDKAGLDDALAGKASASHTHTIADVQNLQTTLNGKANSSHTHKISNITNLQSSLDAKATVTALNSLSETVTNLQNSLNSLTTMVNNINSNYMPKSGGTFTGAITVQGQVKGRSFRVG